MKKNQYTDNRSSVNSNRSNMVETKRDNLKRKTKGKGGWIGGWMRGRKEGKDPIFETFPPKVRK